MAQTTIEALYNQYANKFKAIYKDFFLFDMHVEINKNGTKFVFFAKLHGDLHMGKATTHQTAFNALIDDIHKSFPEDFPSSDQITVAL